MYFIFTPGSLMYTGGGENVLVKWNLENPQARNYLPRLSAEITFIEISKNFEYVAIATLDNSEIKIYLLLNLLCIFSTNVHQAINIFRCESD